MPIEPIKESAPGLSPLKRALIAIEQLETRLAESERAHFEPIAVIGMGCRFPQAENPEEFWRLLRDGVDAVTEVPPDRWDIDRYYSPDPDSPGKMSSRWGGFLPGWDRFDAEFFGIAPREARMMDPQQRVLLEVAWEALEHAGQGPQKRARGRTGVFIGMTSADYSDRFYRARDLTQFNAYFASGIARSVAAGRISYALGLEGPNLSIDTACSSSLVAIHTACLYLRSGECQMALAGGVTAILSPELTVAFSKAHMLSPEGRCKTFDAEANGFVRGEGCGVVVLKRLSDAIAGRDNILAVIRGSAINQDGHSGGLTVPSATAQEAVIRQALANARVSPSEVSYVEAHGTGTELGDPIEAHSLAKVFGPGRGPENPLIVGSAKTNVGHLESAAGVAGLIKVVLSMQNRHIPSHLHFHRMNPHIDWRGMPVEIPIAGRAWPSAATARIAGLSSFGFSGTNAHLVIEEAPRPAEALPALDRPRHILALSARSETAFEELRNRHVERLDSGNAPIAETCFTANAGRAHFEYRAAVTGETLHEVAENLRNAVAERVRDRDGIHCIFLFSGQGSQYEGMGSELYRTSPPFHRAIDRCAELLDPQLGEPLREVLWGGRKARLNETAFTQPALFAIEYALAELWRSWGITPSAVLGHSVGEYVAACVAGVFGLEQGLSLIANRARLMQNAAGDGVMSAVFAREEQVRAALGGLEKRASIAALNAPGCFVISGYRDAVESAEKPLLAAGIRVERLPVSHAFHSPQMDELDREWTEIVSQIHFQPPRVPLISSVTGRVTSAEEITSREYWRRQIREPVRFEQAVATLAHRGAKVFLEIGPGTTLVSLGRRSIEAEGQLWTASLRKNRADWEQMLDALSKLYVRGAEIDWDGFDQPFERRSVALPTYPFERQSYWMDPKPAGASAESPTHPLLGERTEIAGRDLKHVWQCAIDPESLSYLADHRAFDRMVFPLTGYLEMMRAALADAGRLTSCPCDVAVLDPCLLEEGESKILQVQLEEDRISIYGRGREGWKCHVTARAGTPAVEDAAQGAESLEERKHRLWRGPQSNVDAYYASIAGRGMKFGPAFRPIRKLWTAAGELLAYLESDADLEIQRYGIHPALLDGCLQACASLLPQEGGDLYLPFALDEFELLRPARRSLWAHATIRKGPVEVNSVTCDVTVLDESGLIALVRGIQLRRLGAKALERLLPQASGESLFEIQWEAAASEPRELAGDWLLVGADANSGKRFTTVETIAEAKTALAGKSYLGVVHMASLHASSTESLDAARLMESQEVVCRSLLELVQLLAAESEPPRLVIATRGAQRVTGAESSVSVTQAPAWGMAMAILAEHREFRPRLIDLDPDSRNDIAEVLAAELSIDDAEDQVAYRASERYVARLAAKPRYKGAGIPQRLTVSAPGLIEHLKLEPAERPLVPDGFIEIRADAAGLNFRDVLSALGMYPVDPGPLGSECAGTVISVGRGVAGIDAGDEVIAIVSGGMNGYVLADARLAAPRPRNLSTEMAGAVPTAFLTARYTLEHLAKIREGQLVLIHAATGGVGLAAVRIAQRAGAEIFATAGSDRKRDYLRTLGVRHVMDSRSTDFARQILDLTSGRGVDIVLNSLTGEAIAASFSVTAAGGTFLEIGKRAIWTPEKVAALEREIRYHVVDLADTMAAEPEILGALLRQTVAEIESGELSSLPTEIFSFANAEDAFRLMAKASHIGKIVLRQNTFAIRSGATYLIAGGLGALGLQLARWLVNRGATHVVLTARSAPDEKFESLRDWAATQGARVVAKIADISRRESVASLLSGIEAAMPPLWGVIHAAAVLADGTLMQQDWQRFETVLAPKIAGSWNLHELTRGMALDFFVMFSSVAAVLPAPGQANYAAGNAFEDALAHERRRRGLAATSINWGAWAIGLAAAEGLEARRTETGVGTFSVDAGLALLDSILLDGSTQAAAGIFDWHRLSQRFAPLPPRFSRMGAPARPAQSAKPKDDDFPASLKRTLAANRSGMIQDRLRSIAMRVLGFPASRPVPSDRALSDLGLDSLMAVEFRNTLAALLERNLPATLLFSYPSIDVLSEHVSQLIFGGAPQPAAEPKEPPNLLDELESMSDEEVDLLLSNKNREAL